MRICLHGEHKRTIGISLSVKNYYLRLIRQRASEGAVMEIGFRVTRGAKLPTSACACADHVDDEPII
jgi:hypothetical protein